MSVAPVYNCAYNTCVSFEWDSAKAKANLRKHGIDFADAVAALEDEAALTTEDASVNEERLATAQERKQYEAGA